MVPQVLLLEVDLVLVACIRAESQVLLLAMQLLMRHHD
jgi:hypothetical protein